MTGQVGHHKHKVAKFFGYFVLCQSIAGRNEFCGLFLNLVDDLIGGGPVKPDACRTVLQLYRAQQRGQANSDPVQRTFLRFACALCRFDRLPVAGLLFCRLVTRFVAEHMRVTRHHLVRNAAHNGLKAEMPQFFAYRGVIDGLKQEIAQFALQFRPVLTRDGIGDLIGFLDGVGRDSVKCLLDIPRTARFGITQTAHDL